MHQNELFENVCSTTLTCNEYGVWNVENGVNGETCVDYKSGDNELWCKTVRIPDCADRTIYCTDPPSLSVATTNIITRPGTTYKPGFSFFEHKTQTEILSQL